jgi:NAD(P)H-hydrate epimerase
MMTSETICLAGSADMKKMDADCVKRQSISFADLMERAAAAVFDCIARRGLTGGRNRITILCGPGNNGGDGHILGRLFTETGYDVRIINISKISNISEEFLSDTELQKILAGSDIIIDAVFGTGFRGELTGEALRVIKCANEICRGGNLPPADSRRAPLRISVDVPSGVNCDDGTADENSFEADLTITFEFIKTGLVSYPGAGFAGEIETVSIGFTKETRDIIFENPRKSILLTRDYAKISRTDLLTRDCAKFSRTTAGRPYRNTNKGDFGKLLAICGSKNMTGAAYFAAMGALRTGVGLLYLASEEKALDILQTKLNEPIFVPLDFDRPAALRHPSKEGNFDAVLVGPGLGIENSRKIISCLPRASSIIFDADGINALCGNINILHELSESQTDVMLTPHPGEMARLCRAAGTGFESVNSPADVQKNRVNIASDFARRYNCTLVLKGANTVIAGRCGDIYINPTGNPGMSKGGAGDILAGMAASYCAQGIDPVKSACIAVYLHGLAGDIAARRYSETGMMPSDMPDIIGELQK